MALILDTVAGIVAPPSLVLFDDTTGRNIWYAPKEWKLHTVNGQPAISYFEDQASDTAFLQCVFAPSFDQDEFDEVKKQAAAQGKSLNPVRYLGKDESSKAQTQIRALLDLPDDPKFRFKVNGGQGGFMANPIPMVFSMNLVTGRIIKGIINSKNIGMVLQFGAVIRGATTTFEANVYVDYDRCYERLSVHVSVDWWIWSSDWQAAWQELTESGSVKIEILGGTADQKAIVYKTMEYMRDLFFKPELKSVTSPSHPTGGIIRTSVTYEKQHEHKIFKLELRERDFTDAPYNCATYTGQQNIGALALTAISPVVPAVFEAAIAGGSRVKADFFDSSVLKAIEYQQKNGGGGRRSGRESTDKDY